MKKNDVQALESRFTGNELTNTYYHNNDEKIVRNESVFTILGTRDKEVLYYMAKGLTSLEIAKTLSIEKCSVDSCKHRMKVKLGIENPKMLMNLALQYYAYVEKIRGGDRKKLNNFAFLQKMPN